jgi:hypothetical protein
MGHTGTLWDRVRVFERVIGVRGVHMVGISMG